MTVSCTWKPVLVVLGMLFVGCAQANTVTYSGYVVDDLCFDKCVSSPGCEKCALDKTNVITRPEDHTVHCIRDVQVCIDSGFGLMMNTGTADDPDYEIRFKFDDRGNKQVFDIIASTPTFAGLSVTATGEDNNDGYLRDITVIVECNTTAGDVCDGRCQGCTNNNTLGGLQTTTKPDLVKAHGAMLIIAWVFLAPAAALIKRHTNTLPSLRLTRRTCGFPLAFLLHATIMSCVALLTIIAVVIALANFTQRALYGHIGVGITVFVLAILQPIEGLFFRPAHGSPRRIYFNIVHHYTGGFLVMILGVVNVITGTMNYQKLWDMCEAPVFKAFAYAGIGIFGGLAVLLEAFRLLKSKQAPTTETTAYHATKASSGGSDLGDRRLTKV